MGFSGKTTYGAGSELPELAEDVTDLVSVVSPFETPLLDMLGDAPRPAHSTVHEWMEDSLLLNFDTINQTVFTPNPSDTTTITVANVARFQVGDLLRRATRRRRCRCSRSAATCSPSSVGWGTRPRRCWPT